MNKRLSICQNLPIPFNRIFVCIILIFHTGCANAVSIIIHSKNATAWLPAQTIRAELSGFSSSQVTVHHNSNSFLVAVPAGGSFSFPVWLQKDSNTIWIEALNGNTNVTSAKLTLILGYVPFNIIRPLAIVSGNMVTLKPQTVEDVMHVPIKYQWKAISTNPAITNIVTQTDSTAQVAIPEVKGDYHFQLIASASGTTDTFETYVTRTAAGLVQLDIKIQKPAWINDAVIYQVTPYVFVDNCRYRDIEAKLPEISSLGVNTIYLQPLFKTYKGGQGYDIIDYFSLREDLGTESELGSLISVAKSLKMKVIFDFVPNHTYIGHPYAQDVIANGTESHYYDFYQHEKDGVMYSSNYHKSPEGFIYYFWNDLMNLNYQNEEVQRWMLEACKYWLKKYHIDGYRFDAIWGVNARTPGFGMRLRSELKSIQPDFLMLAEDKASLGDSFKKGFDAAYDWTKDTGWVSQWSWQYEFDSDNSHTIFNHPSINTATELLKKALFTDVDTSGITLHFLENNDQHRFISNHSPGKTKMAATLLFSIPGIPMLYNGQEIGFPRVARRTDPIFSRNIDIRAANPGLFDFYKKVIDIRAKHPALHSGSMKEIIVSNAPGTMAFKRSTAEEDIIVVINMSGTFTNPGLMLDGINTEGNAVSLTDLLTGDTVISRSNSATGFTIRVDPYTTRVLLLNRNAVIPPDNTRNLYVFPNPSNGNIHISYNASEAGVVSISIYDIFGRLMLNRKTNVMRGISVTGIPLKGFSQGQYYIVMNNGKIKNTASFDLAYP